MSAPLLDSEWLADLCREQHPKILGICRSRLHDEQDALDACQETYTRAFTRMEKLRASEQPAGWLVETAKRVCWESIRRRDRDLAPYARHQGNRIADARDREALLEELADLVESLPPILAVVCRLTLRGQHPREIAAALGISEDAVNLRLMRARRRLVELKVEQRRQDGV